MPTAALYLAMLSRSMVTSGLLKAAVSRVRCLSKRSKQWMCRRIAPFPPSYASIALSALIASGPGDGTFSDRTELNRPRYLIRFNRLPIFQTGAYQFQFRGLPHEKMTLVLYVDDKSSQQDDELKSLQTVIEASLLDSHGNDICKSSRPPGLNDKDGAWVLSGAGDDQAIFWHWQCHNFQAYRLDSYELTIRVTRADPRGEKIFVTPTLEGGGIEFDLSVPEKRDSWKLAFLRGAHSESPDDCPEKRVRRG